MGYKDNQITHRSRPYSASGGSCVLGPGPGAGANIREWRSLKSLQELNLKGCYKIEDTGLQGLSLMTSLTSLNLQECWQITAEGLASISGSAHTQLSQQSGYRSGK